MAQPAPPDPPAAPAFARPLPRRAPGPRSARPRFQLLDSANAVLFPALFLAVCHFLRLPLTTKTVLGALSVAALYGVGWRTAGRACGLTAALFLATSVSFAREVGQAPVVEMGAVFLSVFCVLLWACATTRAARMVWVVAVLAGGGGLVAGSAWGQVAGPRVGLSALPLDWLVSAGQAFLTWLFVPLVAELGERAKRARWLPCLLWAAAALAAACFLAWPGVSLLLFVLPPAFVLGAGGMARLLPTLAGEVPALRYGLATLAVMGLVLIRARAEGGFVAP